MMETLRNGTVSSLLCECSEFFWRSKAEDFYESKGKRNAQTILGFHCNARWGFIES